MDNKIKQSSFSVEVLTQMLQNQQSKLGQLRNRLNESFHEYQNHNLDHLRIDLLQGLLHLLSKNNTHSPAFNNILRNINANASSLLSFAQQISPILNEQSVIALSHKQIQSQSLLLSLYLSKDFSSKIDLVIYDSQLRGVGHIISEETEADRLGYAKEVADKEGVILHDMGSWQEHSWIGKDSVIVVDVFGISPAQYRPFLLRHKSKLGLAKKVVLYHSHLQDKEIALQLNQLEDLKYWLPLEIWPEHPLEAIVEKDEPAMLERLISFLKEEVERPLKQDIVIFFPVDTHIRKFTSKIGQILSKHHVREYANIVNRPFQSQPRNKNNIFLVSSAKQLNDWDYDYTNLFYLIDYQTESTFRFDYSINTYVQHFGLSSGAEKARRIAFVNTNRVGRYACLQPGISPNSDYLEAPVQLSTYIIKMIQFGLGSFLELKSHRLSLCLKRLESLGIVNKEGDSFAIADHRILEACQEGINPVEAKLALDVMDDSSLSQQQRKRLANLMVMVLVVLHSEGNLRQGKQQIQSVAHIKPNGIWRKSGYIESCLQIITKYELIQNRKIMQNSKSQTFRRKTSKISEYQYNVFGSLFEVIEPKKKGFEEMEEDDFLRECTINDELFLQAHEEIFDFRSALNLEKVNIIFDRDDLTNVIRRYLWKNPSSVAIYSGSRREGYRISNSLPSVFPDKRSLMCQLNQRPECVWVNRLSCSDKRYQILMGNAFTSELHLEMFGQLPSRRSQSQGEMEVEFHGISSSTFEELWRNNGESIIRFENEYGCFVEPNQEMAMIMIHCKKESQSQIKAAFEAILTKIREKISNSNKIMHYLGNTNLLLGAGGSIKEIIKTNYIGKCLLTNLHLDVTLEDLEDLFEDLFVLKKIELQQPQSGKFFKTAQITFNSQRDYYKFYECFNECLYFDRLIEVKPILEQNQKNLVRAKQYIQFRWFVWRSHKKALVRFATPQQEKKAFESLKGYPQLDGAQVVVTSEEKGLIIDNLNSHTDEIYIEEAMRGYGEIKDVEILKTPLKEVSGDDIYLETLIKNALLPQQNQQNQNNQQNLNQLYKMQPIQKSKNGLRICRVHLNDVQRMVQIANDLNKTIGKLGEGRLYAQTWFQTPVMVPYGSMTIYQEIIRQLFNEVQVTNIKTYIVQQNKKTYIILKSPIKQTLDTFHQRLSVSLQGYAVELTDYQKTVILSEIGLANLLDLEEKYHCKLIVDEIKRTLSVLVAFDKKNTIHAEIKARVQDHFFYRLSLNRKAFKHLKTQPEKLQEIQSNYALRLVELEIDSMALLLEGSALNVQKAFNYLMHLIESLTVTEEEMINADVCGICCSEPHRPYRLQHCCHKFCRSCLLDYITTVLGDNSMFPIKCPHCFKEIVVDDLDCILEPGQWAKVLTMATNQYLAKHAEVMTFCFTAGCKQINMIKSDHIECDVCLATYCIECKMRYHPGITCEQARNGGDEAFKKYMRENGIRQCPNEKCKIPVIRVDGCYRITCSRCNKSMCFKCEPDKMIAYDNYNDCYKHLNDVHGGYW